MDVDGLEYVDLRSGFRQDLLDGFIRLYDEAFTDPSEREDPDGFARALRNNPTQGDPPMHLLVAHTGSGALGGALFEYFPTSRCGLLSYLVVDPAARRRGIARELVARTRTILKQEAAESGGSLVMLFAETEDPRIVSDRERTFSPVQRLRALHRLGARWIDVPYVQPELSGGGGRCRHLLLIAFPQDASERSINGVTVTGFLRELYISLDVTDPEKDSDFQAITRALGDAVPLLDAPMDAHEEA